MPAQYAENIPKVCKAAKVKNNGPDYVVDCVEDYPVPEAGPEELLIRLACTGLCMSDHHYMAQDWGIPMLCDCGGHEGAGVVVGIGERVPEGSWKLGDRVGMKPVHDTCGACEFCRNGNETVCDQGPYTGMHFNGSYAEYLTSPARYTARIADGVPDEVAGPIMCSGATVYAALKRAKLTQGQWVVVYGSTHAFSKLTICRLGAGGGVGSMCCTFAVGLGYRVIGVDTGDDKKKMVMDMGVEHFVDFMTTKDPFKEVQELTKGGAHAVLGCGGTAKSYVGATNYLRKTGTLVVVGLPSAGAIVGGEPFSIATRKLTITGSVVGSIDEIASAMDLAARHKIKPYITVYPWKRFAEIQKKLVATQITGRAVIFFNNDVEEHRVNF